MISVASCSDADAFIEEWYEAHDDDTDEPGPTRLFVMEVVSKANP